MRTIVILASGSGTLAQALFDAVSAGQLDAHITAVISDHRDALVINRAQKSGIATYILPMLPDRSSWNSSLISLLDSLSPDLVVSAGFMRILSQECVDKFRIINSHPALLPLYPGAHGVRDALAGGATKTGTTIHWVDAGVDTGAIIAQQELEVRSDDTEATLHERIKVLERGLIVATIRELLPTLESSNG